MERLAREVRELLVASDHYRRTVAAGLGIGIAESAVLGHLLHRGPQTPTLIRAWVGLSPASTTALVDRLVKVRLVRRVPHPSDRRSVLIEFTDLGHSAVVEMDRMFAVDVDAALEVIDARVREDRELVHAVTDLLGRIAAAMRERSGDLRGIEQALAGIRGGSLPEDASPG